MSMPTFPESGLHISQEQAFNMILASIAMEELSLSHIMNAEGEKLQYVLGTLPGSSGGCATTQELLEVNKSIIHLLDAVMQNQIMLKGKLERVLEAKERHSCDCCSTDCPCVSSHEKSVFHEKNPYYCWKAEHCFPWKPVNFDGCSSDTICCHIDIPRGKEHLLNFEFCLRECVEAEVFLYLQDKGAGAPTLLKSVKTRGMTICGQSIHVHTNCSSASLFFTLSSPALLCIERASLTLYC